MWDLIVSVPDHCLSFYFKVIFLKLVINDRSDKMFLLASKFCSQGVVSPCPGAIYEGRSEIIETITILSKGLNVIQNNLHSHQVLHIWGLGQNLNTSLNGYDPVAFLRLIPPLPRSTTHYVDVHCTVSFFYCHLNEQATINSFASKIHLYQ